MNKTDESIIALKISLFQTQAVYRNPLSTEIIETYPLPPPSTVLGLISTMIKKPLNSGEIDIAISGSFDSLYQDYQWYKKYSTTKPYPILVHTLSNVQLTLHITTFENKDLLGLIRNAFEKPPSYLYLGRAEDLIKINSVDLVHIYKKTIPNSESLEIKKPTFIKSEDAAKLKIRGVLYQLATFMHQKIITLSDKKETTKMIRDFDWCLYDYFDGTLLQFSEDILFSHDGEEFLWWSMPNQTH